MLDKNKHKKLYETKYLVEDVIHEFGIIWKGKFEVGLPPQQCLCSTPVLRYVLELRTVWPV